MDNGRRSRHEQMARLFLLHHKIMPALPIVLMRYTITDFFRDIVNFRRNALSKCITTNYCVSSTVLGFFLFILFFLSPSLFFFILLFIFSSESSNFLFLFIFFSFSNISHFFSFLVLSFYLFVSFLSFVSYYYNHNAFLVFFVFILLILVQLVKIHMIFTAISRNFPLHTFQLDVFPSDGTMYIMT